MIRRFVVVALLALAPLNALLAVDLPFQSTPERTPPIPFYYPNGTARRIATTDIIAYAHEWGDTAGRGLYADIEFEVVIHGETTGFWIWEDAPLGKYFFKVANTDSVFLHPQRYRMGFDLVPPQSVDSAAIVAAAVATPHLADSLISDQRYLKANTLHTRHILGEEVKEGDIAPDAISSVHLQAGVAAQNLFDPETHVSLAGDRIGLPDSTYLELDTLNVRIVGNFNTLLVQSDSTMNPTIAVLRVDEGGLVLRVIGTFEENITAEKNVDVGDTLDVEGPSILAALSAASLEVSGAASFTSALATVDFAGSAQIGNDLTIDDRLFVDGRADFDAAIDAADSSAFGTIYTDDDSLAAAALLYGWEVVDNAFAFEHTIANGDAVDDVKVPGARTWDTKATVTPVVLATNAVSSIVAGRCVANGEIELSRNGLSTAGAVTVLVRVFKVRALREAGGEFAFAAPPAGDEDPSREMPWGAVVGGALAAAGAVGGVAAYHRRRRDDVV